jgi:hypothetical protein
MNAPQKTPTPNSNMNMLYDSDAFVVVHQTYERKPDAKDRFASLFQQAVAGLVQHAFEIVDKRRNVEIFLTDQLALAFQQQIKRWQANTPTQNEVEEILDGYCALATNPLVMH